LERVIASLWLLVQFGGLGTRVRRGAGAFSCRLKEDKEGVVSSLGISFDSELKNNYKRIKKILKEEGGSDKNPLLFTSLTANEKIYVSSFDKDKQWHECLRPIAKEFMDFRSSKKSEWDKIAVFGIPIRHSSTGGTVQLPKSNRRASPLLISVCKQNGILQWVIVKTSGFFDTSRNGAESLSVVMKGNGFEKGTVDKSRLDDFIKGIDEKTQIA
jgi:CRISPR/Cas system CMR-associated protein Cmr1 (group 7 of RAMP superfamily)